LCTRVGSGLHAATRAGPGHDESQALEPGPGLLWVNHQTSVATPYRATTGAQPPELAGPRVKEPSRFRWWWACFLIGNLLWNIAARLIVGQSSFGSRQSALSLDLVAQVVLIAAVVSFIGVLSSITRNLRRRASA
jgi:hypothetical protein